MEYPLLFVKNLTTTLFRGKQTLRPVDGVSFQLARGETLALLGESGCGKSVTALSIIRLLPTARHLLEGQIWLLGRDLQRLSETEMRGVRGRQIAMIFQDPQNSLNPVITIGAQIAENLRVAGRNGRRQRVMELLDAVGISDPGRRIDEYPHQLSGGMRQRVMIAVALAGEPDLLIADEPTTALDVTIQAQVLDLLRELQHRTSMGILLITHDLGVVSQMADRVAVMYAGQLVEEGPCGAFFQRPHHPYARKLFASLPQAGRRGFLLSVIPGSVPSPGESLPGCRFAPRCEHAWSPCFAGEVPWVPQEEERKVRCHLYAQGGYEPGRLTLPGPASEARHSQPASGETTGQDRTVFSREILLQVADLKVYFPLARGFFSSAYHGKFLRAVDGVSMVLHAGETLALVGESGSGKTTVAKCLLRLIRPTAGHVHLAGEDLGKLSGQTLQHLRREIQIVFQDPYASMNPRMRVAEIIAEGMIVQRLRRSRDDRLQRVEELLLQVGLLPEAKQRYPHEFSGGQRQRICIARALAVEPRILVCDEPTSALDVSVQAQILNLFTDLQRRLGLAYLFITHNLALVQHIAHTVAVMYLGRIVESGPVERVLGSPKHPYTQALLAAVPRIDPTAERSKVRLLGETPSPSRPPDGCAFHPRCPHKQAMCERIYPDPALLEGNHRVHCHLYR